MGDHYLICSKMMKVFVSLLLLGAASAELTCEDCSMIGEKVSAAATTPEAIQGMLDMLVESGVCEKFPDNVEECMLNLPVFWNALAKAMFDAETGWFSSQYLCHAVCVPFARSVLSAPSCVDCDKILYESLGHMGDKEKEKAVIQMFKDSNFCDQFGEENMEQCMSGLEIVIPDIMYLLSSTGDQWIKHFCAEDVGCA